MAREVREHATALKGLALLGPVLTVPATLRREYNDQKWLKMRLSAAAGLASHLVLSAMRSSTAALLEHVVGTEEAVAALGITGLTKPQPTGATLAKVTALPQQGPPKTDDLDCELPMWLTNPDAWSRECEAELVHYEAVQRAARRLGDNRERAKAELVNTLARRHPRILAFDRHPITLAAIRPLIDVDGVEVIIASGAATRSRRQVQDRFSADSDKPGIALCTDAMSEGLNLQGASVIVHFDLPTTLRVAEQRVGRVDRMDSPYDRIEAWWPSDSEAFATRANELLAARNAESAALLGSNLPIPDLVRRGEAKLDVQVVIHALEDRQAEVWDGIRDALDPVRQLVTGPEALLPSTVYRALRTDNHRVLARVSPVQSSQPWAFFAVRGHADGAPRWVLLEGPAAHVVHGLDDVTKRLRHHLQENPPPKSFDDDCERWLDQFLLAAAKAEARLIPRRLQRALQQMHATARQWARAARSKGDFDEADRWEAIARLAQPEDDESFADFHQVGERWLRLVHPLREQARRERRHARYSKISDIDPLLRREPLPLPAVEASLGDLHALEPFDQRVSACILGVPSSSSSDPTHAPP